MDNIKIDHKEITSKASNGIQLRCISSVEGIIFPRNLGKWLPSNAALLHRKTKSSIILRQNLSPTHNPHFHLTC